MAKITLPVSQKDVIYRGSNLSDEFELERSDIAEKYQQFWRSWRRVTICGETQPTWDEFLKWDGLDVEYLIFTMVTGDIEAKRKHLPQLFAKADEAKVEEKQEPTE